jgi:hypothetical protein
MRKNSHSGTDPLDKSRFLIISEIINSSSADEDALRNEIDSLSSSRVESICDRSLE